MRISDWSSDVCSSDLFNGAAPAVAPRRAVGTTWKVQTSWPGGVGLDTFKAWCHSIVEKTSGELSFEPYAPNELVGEFQLFDGLRRGELQAMNSFTQKSWSASSSFSTACAAASCRR